MTTACFPSSTLRLQTLALLREQIISRSLMDGGSVDDFIVDALRGVHPACRNVTHAKCSDAACLQSVCERDAAPWPLDEALVLVTLAHTAARSMRALINAMQDTVAATLDGIAPPDAERRYLDKAATLTALIGSVSCSGIALFDSACWAANSRLAYSPKLGRASLIVRQGGSKKQITLWDLSYLKNAFSAEDLGQEQAPETATLLFTHNAALSGITQGFADAMHGGD